MGVTILNNIEIKGFEKMNGHLVLHTYQPFTLTASQLLVCTMLCPAVIATIGI